MSASADDDEQLSRAAFLYRTAATATSPIYPQPYHRQHSPSSSRPASPHLRSSSPSPSSRHQPLQRSSASAGNLSLQRHSSSSGRKKPASLVEPLPLTPHEQVLRARLERVLISGRIIDDKERSRERRRSANPDREHRDDVPGWPWSEKEPHNTVLASTPPKSSTSGSSDRSNYLYQHQHQHPQHQHQRSRSKTDPVSPPPAPPATPRRATTTPAGVSPYSTKSTSRPYPPTQSPLPTRNNSNSSSAGTTPPLTADRSPVFGQESLILQHQHQQQADPDDMRLLTPPPTPPPTEGFTPGSGKRSLYRTRSGEPECPPSPFPYHHLQKRMENLDLGVGLGHPSSACSSAVTFNARKASERCRMMEGYVSFANVEGLGTPPDGVDDREEQEEEKDGLEEKRGRGIGAIGGWARRLFVGIGNGANANANTTASYGD